MSIDLTVKSIRQETPDVKSFILQPTSGIPFVYKPGQFLTVIHPDRPDQRRSYSFSSHPAFDEPTITLRRIANGEVSRWFFDAVKTGDTIPTAGVSGLFTLPDDVGQYEALVFLCAGTGITPAMSLIKEALKVRRAGKVILIYSNRNPASTVFLAEIEKLSEEFPEQLVVKHFFSNSQDLSKARVGRLALEALLEEHITQPARVLFFLCGPHVYMDNITITLLTAGVPDTNIRREIFFNPEPLPKIEPPDRDSHIVSVQYLGKHYSFPVKYPDSILQTAKKLGILLPYSCEAGRCGTCAATCTNGDVWMLRNEVLLDKEIARGRILTCTGYPVGGDVDLVIE
jgi:ferredoxin-NADP reductase